MEPTVAQWNAKYVNVAYAALGEISPNVRSITLDWHEGKWVIKVVLQEEDLEEIERIQEDIFTDVEASDGESNIQGMVETNAGPHDFPDPPTRVIYWRREL
jgi:hypothetical protein